jgi:multimeric flavodoxin WrbA
MRVIAINGSPRRGGNTQVMIEECAKALRGEGVDVEVLHLRDFDVRPCTACDSCYTKHWKCPIKDDAITVLRKMVDADGVVLGSAVYGADVTAQMKALLDRGILPYTNQDLKNKVGGAIIVGGGSHGGQEMAMQQIISFFAFQGMIPAGPSGSLYGALATANDKGDVRKDKEGMKSARELGKRMAELMRLVGR